MPSAATSHGRRLAAALLLAACTGDPPTTPSSPAVPPKAPPLSSETATSIVTVPGSRVSLRLPTRAQRVGRAFTYQFQRAGTVQVRVAEASVGATPPHELRPQLDTLAGVDPDTELLPDPDDPERWHTQLDLPRQAHVRHVRAGNAAAAVLVGIESLGDLDVVETILDSVTVDPRATRDAAELLGITIDAPAGTSRGLQAGPIVLFESDDPTIDGGLTVAWVPSGIEVGPAMLESGLRELIRERVGVDDPAIEAVELGTLRGSLTRGEVPDVGHYLLVTAAVPGEQHGFFMIYAGASGPGSEAFMPALVTSARSLRVR